MEISYREKIKSLLSIVLWFAYIITLPKIYNINAFIGVAMMLFPGFFLYTWLTNYLHDIYHRYISDSSNHFLFHLFAALVWINPQVFRIGHQSHHSKVHTYEDLEFYPLGKINNRWLRKLFLILEVIFGTILIVICATEAIKKRPDFSYSKLILSICYSLLIYSFLAIGSQMIFGVGYSVIISSLLINFLICNCLLHHMQLMEHGFILADGDVHERSQYSRNLKPDGWMEKFFLFLNHQEPIDHCSHHKYPSDYTRHNKYEADKSESLNCINLKEYWAILKAEFGR